MQLDKELILGLFSGESSKAITKFIDFNEEANEDKCLDDETIKRMTDDHARKEIEKVVSLNEMTHLKSMEKQKRDEILMKMKQIEGLTQRQVARLLGISPNLIFKL